MPIHATIEPSRHTGTQRGAERMRIRIETPGSFASGETTTVVIHNLSATGMLIETASHLTIGQRFIITLPEAPDVSATVVWRSDALAGCRFDRPLSRAILSAAQLRNPLPADVDPSLTAGGSELLPQRLYRLRKELGLSRAALSARTGLSKPSIWAWEIGKTAPRRNSLMVLADAFGMSVEELIGGDLTVNPADDADHAQQLQQLIDGSKERIAALAGIKTSNIKIFIEF